MSTEIDLPDNLPAVANARLPQTYEAAKQALSQCSKIDECQDWADKAAALASYARQADDSELHTMATRIRARAIRKCGELLSEFDARPANAEKQSTGDHTLLSQRDAAQEAGLSKHQQVTAVRVANVPSATFEAAIESPKPATVTKLADMGKRESPKPAFNFQGRTKEEFAAATRGHGAIDMLREVVTSLSPALLFRGLLPHEIPELKQTILRIQPWLDALLQLCKEPNESGNGKPEGNHSRNQRVHSKANGRGKRN